MASNHPTPAGLFFVVAAYNEGTVIARTVREIRQRYPHVVVVDDGSRDRTAQEALAAGATVLVHPLNQGQGAALQTGIDYALEQGAERIVTFDGDGQHDLDDVPVMLEAMDRGGVDVVLGSRFLGRTSGMPWRRRVFLKVAVLFTNLTTGIRLTDTHNGLRMLGADAARRIRITQNGMAHASEILEQIAAARLSWVEVPVHIRYTEYSLSKGQSMSNAVRILSDLFGSRMTKW